MIPFPNNINLIHDRLNLLFVGIGASGDASNFHKEINDNSLRLISRNLFLPSLILRSNWDIFKKFIDLNGFKLSLNNVRNSKMIKLICSFGRALWSSLPLRSVITVAKKKLTNGSSANFYPAMAFWSMRTGLSLNSDLMLSRTLVRSYMAIVFSTSYDAQLMNVGYPSEPILAIASRDLLDFETLLYALLEFVQHHPIDKAEVTASIFSHIVLLAIDNSSNVASRTDEMIICDEKDEQLSKIFNANVFLLESVPDKSLSGEVNDDSSTDGTKYDTRSEIQSFYHITTVESFLKTLYGNFQGLKICDALGSSLRNGIINGSHVIRALGKFPYEKVYTATEIKKFKLNKNKNKDKNKAKNKNKNINDDTRVIDQALLRNLFLRQAILKMPPGYYGLDLCIPVLLERPDGNEAEEGTFGYIGIQFNSSFESEKAVIKQMHPKLHYINCWTHKHCESESCGTKTSDFEYICKNNLMLYMAAEYVEEKFHPLELGIYAQRPYKTVTRAAKVSTYDGVPYYVTKSIFELSGDEKILNRDHFELIQKIIHPQNDPFKCAEPVQARKIADNVLTMGNFSYLSEDADLRISRGQSAMPDPFFDDEEHSWFNIKNIIGHLKHNNLGKFKKRITN